MEKQIYLKLQRLTTFIFIDFMLDFSDKLLKTVHCVTVISKTEALIENWNLRLCIQYI